MNEHHASPTLSRRRWWVMSVRQMRSVAAGKPGEWWQIGKIYRVKWIGDAAHRVRRGRATEDDSGGTDCD